MFLFIAGRLRHSIIHQPLLSQVRSLFSAQLLRTFVTQRLIVALFGVFSLFRLLPRTVASASLALFLLLR